MLWQLEGRVVLLVRVIFFEQRLKLVGVLNFKLSEQILIGIAVGLSGVCSTTLGWN